MTRTRAIAALVLLSLLSTALASCGDDEERLTKAAFTKRMNTLCKERDKKIDPLLNGNFFDMKEGQKVWPKVETQIDAYIDRVREVNPPEDADDLFDDYLDQADEVTGTVDDVIEAARNEDQKAYSKSLAVLFGDFDGVDKRIDEYGAKDCRDEENAFPQSEKPAAGATTVEIGGTEYAFEMPSSIKAGKTAFKLVNNGDELHIFGYGRLKEGATFEQLKAKILEEDDPGLLEEEGISGVAAPDESTTVNADLTPGTYAAYCFIPAPDGTPHLAKGMLAEFTVS